MVAFVRIRKVNIKSTRLQCVTAKRTCIWLPSWPFVRPRCTFMTFIWDCLEPPLCDLLPSPSFFSYG